MHITRIFVFRTNTVEQILRRYELPSRPLLQNLVARHFADYGRKRERPRSVLPEVNAPTLLSFYCKPFDNLIYLSRIAGVLR